MEEQIISFETAKLAKEKGFDLICDIKEGYHNAFIKDQSLFQELWYDKYGVLCQIEYPGDESLTDYVTINNYKDIYLAPTQSILQKWLRDVHNIHLVPSPSDFINDPAKILYKIDVIGFKHIILEDFNTYEDALEAALKEALNLIP